MCGSTAETSARALVRVLFFECIGAAARHLLQRPDQRGVQPDCSPDRQPTERLEPPGRSQLHNPR